MTKTSTILTTTSLIALLSSFGLMACGGAEVEPADQSQSASLAQPGAKTPAPEAMRPEARGDRHGPRGEHGFGPPSPEKMIERFDTNKNGQLEAAELPPRMQENIGEIDTSGDGVVTKDELAARFKAKFAEHQAKFAEHAKARFDAKDTNHDGTLDQTEVGAEHWAKLSVADANGDQKLSPEELKAAFESGKIKPPMRGERGERGGRWEHGRPEAPPAGAPVAPAAPAAPTPAL
jgi:EF hand